MQGTVAGHAHIGRIDLHRRAEHGLKAGRNLAGHGMRREVDARRDEQAEAGDE
jgi:hypothetical protein